MKSISTSVREVAVKFRGQVNAPEQLGDAIRQGREIQGWSQRELAARLGVTQKWLWELEQGKPGLLMERLFAALREVDVKLFVELDDPSYDEPAALTNEHPSKSATPTPSHAPSTEHGHSGGQP